MKSPAPGRKEKAKMEVYQGHIHTTNVRGQSATEKDSSHQEPRPKTPSRFLRPPSPSKYFHQNQQNRISEHQPKGSTEVTVRPSSPIKQIPIRSSSPSKQINTRPSSPTKQLNTQSYSPPKQLNTQSLSPVKQLSQPIKQEINGVKTIPTYNRSSTPSRYYHGESENRERSKSVGREFNITNNKLIAANSVRTYNDQNKPIQTGRSTPTVNLSKNGLIQDKVPGHHMKTQNRPTSALEAFIMSDNVQRGHRYTPKPIGPDQEQKLYQSLEDEIQSNIKALEEDSDDSSSQDNKCSTFTPSIASDVAVHNFNMKRTSVSSTSMARNRLKTPDGEVEIPRSGVYITTKWHSGGGSYDDVITELSQGQLKLNRVDVENWVSKIPPKEVKAVETGLPIEHSECQAENKPDFSVQKTDTTKLFSVENYKKKVKQLPSQIARQLAMEAKKKSVEAAADNLDSAVKCPTEETTIDLSKSSQSSKPKRSLKKPERVPSIYKLKLRPKIRPRRDNRPEKKPSKIPTPVSYQQKKSNSKNTQKSTANPSSARSRSKSHSTAVSTDDLDTDEAVSELSLSLEASGSQLNQLYNENKENKNEEEETWI